MPYKLFEYDSKEKELYFLMHGLNGSRKVDQDIWLEAEQKTVRDGSGDNYYDSGFHVFRSGNKRIAKYCKKFKLKRPSGRELVIVDVSIRDSCPKPTNESVLLCQGIYVPSYEWKIRVATIINDFHE